jgi:hypothetical protein
MEGHDPLSGDLLRRPTSCAFVMRPVFDPASGEVVERQIETGTATAHVSAPLMAAKPCSSSYKHALIGGVHKCLRRGEYCAVRYKTTCPRYGFRCYGSPARLH